MAPSRQITYLHWTRAYGDVSGLGFRIVGDPDEDGYYGGYIGDSVALLGDINGDGYDDFLLGEPSADGDSGTAYVVFGGETDHGGLLVLNTLDGNNGFSITGTDTTELAERLSAAGDVNGDGFDDFLIAERGDEASGGSVYVLYGTDFTGVAGSVGTSGADSLSGSSGSVIKAGAGDDVISVDATDFFRIDGGGGSDTLVLDGSGLDLNFDTLQSRAVQGIEKIDLTGSGNNSLTISHVQANKVMGSGTTLQIDGDAGDTVTIIRRGDKTVGSTNTTYTDASNNIVISVANAVTVIEQEFAPEFTIPTSITIDENTTPGGIFCGG